MLSTTESQQPQQQPPPHPRLSGALPPLILGTATFNTQYIADPLSMPYEQIVSCAVERGVTAFDTSPYYGPAELLLGAALEALDPRPPRSGLTLITKVGRVGPAEFDYSAAHVRHSVLRSLRRLRTPYLDLVYAHDVEFVSPAEVLCAVRELRRLRDHEGGLVRHVGISGYPVSLLCDLAELVLRETGEPLDAVLSYGNFTVQNRTLGLPASPDPGQDRAPLARLRAAGVDVVLNASMLGMGLLTTAGIPPDPQTPAVTMATTTTATTEPGTVAAGSPLAKWHPSPPALRLACGQLAALAAAAGERLESVAIRWSLGEWARVGARAGFGVPLLPAGGRTGEGTTAPETVDVGATVMGVTSVRELEETVAEWEVVRGELLSGDGDGAERRRRNDKIVRLVEDHMWPALGEEWLDYSWASPEEGYVRQEKKVVELNGVAEDDGFLERYEEAKRRAMVVREETLVSG